MFVLPTHAIVVSTRPLLPETDNPYAILGVKPKAKLKDIRRAYQTLRRRTHPDFGGDPTDFQRVVRAYDILSNPEDREFFDRTRFCPPPESSVLTKAVHRAELALIEVTTQLYSEPRRNIFTTDPIDLSRKALRAQIMDAERRAGGLQEVLKQIKGALKRLSMPVGTIKDSMVGMSMLELRDQKRLQLRGVLVDIRVMKAALLVDKYSFKTDVVTPPPAPARSVAQRWAGMVPRSGSIFEDD